MKVAVSYLSSDNYKKCIELIDDSKADLIHVDMCDGKYVETKNFSMGELIKLLKGAKKKLDIHLMVNNPMKYIDQLAMLNVEAITVHLNTDKDILSVIDYISSIGIKAGIAINPDEDVKLIEPLLDSVDKVLFLSVYPGKGGQAFIPEVLDKVDKINMVKDKYHFETSIDGGINADSIELIKDKNIDIVVSGSFVTNNDNYDDCIKLIKSQL